MMPLRPMEAARGAVSFNPDKAATAVVLDTPDVRLVVFRLQPGQEVSAHRNASTVLLTVLAGSGILTGEDHGAPCERACSAGDVMAYAPSELHAMRASEGEFVLLATIAPRPGSR